MEYTFSGFYAEIPSLASTPIVQVVSKATNGSSNGPCEASDIGRIGLTGRERELLLSLPVHLEGTEDNAAFIKLHALRDKLKGFRETAPQSWP